MKICWDMLEGIYLTRNGFLRKGKIAYVEMDACKVCGEPYLTKKYVPSVFCSLCCAMSGENNPFFGKTHSAETIERISKINSINQIGPLSLNWKGDLVGLALYDNYKDRLGPYEEIRRKIDTELLEVKCAYCGRWFVPTYTEVIIRLRAINRLNCGEGRLYCSENCKQACPTYRRVKYPKGFKHTSSREVSTYLRQLVLERDNWTCQICGKTVAEIQLHVHHMDPVAQNPMLQNDVDSCITLCKDCHKMVHMQYGCRYVVLQCKKK